MFDSLTPESKNQAEKLRRGQNEVEHQCGQESLNGKAGEWQQSVCRLGASSAESIPAFLLCRVRRIFEPICRSGQPHCAFGRKPNVKPVL